ncbi:MAG: glycosyltransferase family 4 protein [Candidatus Gastranaerophilaceae bacterium]|jgi:glycosyltransferase involved in cell wall biosynthesis
MDRKIKIAFVKYDGLGLGGTEKFLQTVAAGLPKDKFDVDYFYAHGDLIPPNEVRKQYLLDNGVNVIEFKTSTYRHHRDKFWLDNSNFFEVYKDNYDIVQTGRCGMYEEPFCDIKSPIVDSLHYIVAVDNQYNIARSMHISEFSKNMWIQKGGDKNRIVMVSHPIHMPDFEYIDLSKQFGLENKFIYGFHQRNDDMIFSDIVLRAYKKVENDNNAFILLGGSEKYREQAKELDLKNIHFLGHTGDKNIIQSFLKTIDLYAHGRSDGELNSTAIAEALYYGKPVVSHISTGGFNGHVECIANAGFVVDTYEQYAEKLKELEQNKDFYEKISQNALVRFKEMYDFDTQMQNIINIYKDVVKNPYPNKLNRLYLHIKQLFPLRRHRRYK